MYAATEEGHLDVVTLLIEHGADVNVSPKGPAAVKLQIENKTPLLIACVRNYGDIARYLIESGADVNIKTGSGSSPLLATCLHNNIILARSLIDAGAQTDAEATNLQGGKYNCLIVAAESGSFDVLRLLVDLGLDVNYKIEGSVR